MTDSSGRSVTILVVEDEADLADLYALWLDDEYAVETAYSGRAALEMLDPSFDIVLLDRRLPDISGDEVLDRVTDIAPGVQVAMISGIAPDFAILGYGIEDYLVKPITREDLQDLVTEMTTRETYPAPKRKLAQLRSRKTALEQYRTPEALTAHQEYNDVLAEIDRLETDLNTE